MRRETFYDAFGPPTPRVLEASLCLGEPTYFSVRCSEIIPKPENLNPKP